MGYKRETRVLGLSNWKMKLIGNKMGQTVERSSCEAKDHDFSFGCVYV